MERLDKIIHLFTDTCSEFSDIIERSEILKNWENTIKKKIYLCKHSRYHCNSEL